MSCTHPAARWIGPERKWCPACEARWTEARPVEYRQIYISRFYEPERVTSCYVRTRNDGGFVVYEVGADNFTLREYETAGAEIPEHIRLLAQEMRSQAFGAIKWKL